jgi:hypothetical protein
MYDNTVRAGSDRIRSIPRLLAKQLHPNNPRSVPAAEKQIRRLVQDRDRRRKAMKAAYERFPQGHLGRAGISGPAGRSKTLASGHHRHRQEEPPVQRRRMCSSCSSAMIDLTTVSALQLYGSFTGQDP